MSEGLDIIVRVAVIGAGATLVLDAWNAALQHFLGIPSLSLGMLGRWFGHFPRGQFMHASIAAASPIPGERAIGWIVHYAIGISWAGILASKTPRPNAARVKSIVSHTVYGIGLYGSAWFANHLIGHAAP